MSMFPKLYIFYFLHNFFDSLIILKVFIFINLYIIFMKIKKEGFKTLFFNYIYIICVLVHHHYKNLVYFSIVKSVLTLTLPSSLVTANNLYFFAKSNYKTFEIFQDTFESSYIPNFSNNDVYKTFCIITFTTSKCFFQCIEHIHHLLICRRICFVKSCLI